MIYSPRSFLLLARAVFDCQGFDDRAFRSHFGCSPDICSILWEKIRRPSAMMGKHLLWGLHFLKSYATEDVLACALRTTRKTLRKWIWTVVRSIAQLKRSVVSLSFESVNCRFHSHSFQSVRSNGAIARSMGVATIDGAW